jgi:hypothetical protein
VVEGVGPEFKPQYWKKKKKKEGKEKKLSQLPRKGTMEKTQPNPRRKTPLLSLPAQPPNSALGEFQQ